ncbi:MAG: hypothetical protein MUC96_31140 [Myxococcaceae bacterium]|jgi:hypothetical protein|nr:hypothetical protein [Myxococcaceae bacterium]
MSDEAPTQAGKPLLERVAVQYFARRSERQPKAPIAPATNDAVHVLNADERRAMRSVQRGAIVRSAVAGALSGLVAAVAEVWAQPLAPEGTPLFSKGSLEFWLVVGVATGVASVLEILYLSWDILRSTHELSRAAGLELFGPNREASDDALVDALARAALELPNPLEHPSGINARRESSKLRLLAASLAYKAKVGVTSFVLKLLLRRVLARVLVRGTLQTLLPFVGVPVTAAWNALVTWWVLREARIRAMGPSAVKQLVDVIFSDAPALSEAGRVSAARAVAASIVRTQDLHPNLTALLDEVMRHVKHTGRAELDDVGEFLKGLRALTAEERRLSLQVLAIACVVDGRFSARERTLWNDAMEAVGKPLDTLELEQLRVAFVRGDGLADDVLRAL